MSKKLHDLKIVQHYDMIANIARTKEKKEECVKNMCFCWVIFALKQTLNKLKGKKKKNWWDLNNYMYVSIQGK